MLTSLNKYKCENNDQETLRYHLYLDCADVHDIITIDGIQIQAILEPILRKRKLPFSNAKIASMIHEIQLEYQRVMCLLQWRRLIESHPEMCQYSSLLSKHCRIIPIYEAIHTVNRNTTDMETFQVTKKKIHWNILYVLPEVYDAMCRVSESCQSMINNISLFVANHGKSMSLNEFEAQQVQSYTSAIKYLNHQWVERIVQSVRMCLRDIGKGCFDLNQKTPHIYSVIKLKRFMELKVLIMQNALGVLIESSVVRYMAMLISPEGHIPHFNSDFTWGSNLIVSQFPPSSSPIFQLELKINERGACYTTDLSQYINTILKVVDDAIVQCHQIRPPQVFLLPKLTFPPELHLNAIGLMDERITHAKNKLIDLYQRLTIPLQAYAKEYDKYLELYNLNIEEHIRNMKKEEFDVARIRDEILSQLSSKDELLTNVPEDISIGPFKIIVKHLRQFLVEKRKNLATRVLDLLTQQLHARLLNFLSQYSEIETKLQKDPQDIEELYELREYMGDIPLNVLNIDNSVRDVVLDYEVLDMFLWNVTDEDFASKWHAIAYPLKIKSQLKRRIEYLKEAFNNFQKLQIVHQENLMDQIKSLGVHLISIASQTDINKVHECAIEAKRVWKLLQNCEEQASQLNKRQRMFDRPIISYENLTKLVRDFEPYLNLWCSASDWLKAQEMWLENPLCNIDSEQMEITLNELNKSILQSAKIFNDQPKIVGIAKEISKKIESFKPYVALVQSLRNPGMKMRHYEKISKQTKIEVITTTNVTLSNLLEAGIMNHVEIITNITENAAKEYSIEASLDKMRREWANIQMDIIPYKNTGTCIMKVLDETLVMLDDHILNTQQIGFSPFRGTFENVIFEWEMKLKLSRDVLNEWISVQRSWMYLEPIFSSEDINRQLPMESRKFNTVERNWRRIMKNASECPNILQICPDKSLLESLKKCTALMDVVQKGLVDYLETRRMVFPRFYFLSDHELLEILAQTKNVRAVQPYLNKCFENIKRLYFEDDTEITRMYSAENEEVYLRPSIYPIGNVENWLGQVENSMKNSLREIIGNALTTVELTARDQWVYMWPGQVVICAGQTYWTYHIEDAIENNQLKSYYKILVNNLEELRKLVRGQPTEIQRLMLEALITIQVHERDVLIQLIDNSVRNVNDFNWISQLRYYWIDNSELCIRVVNAQFSYGYEYLGNNGRLVITPLTDRCYLTLTGALHLKFGGAPTGPAGTGKTETTKDLAKAFAIQCVVFNCSEQLDFISMGKFFKGLASSGAWACFDEFNRIDIEVLSVIAQQILTIQRAQQNGMECFLFEGTDIILKASCAIFVTMNPGYAGRTELPDNLKALFRPVAMMVSNYALIAEISLFSYGFMDAKKLAGKITTTFKLSSEQLSSQDHYDFGMRAVKTVIALAGNLKREQQHLDESQICLRALRNVNVPKFIKNDLILFEGIIMDLFPGLMGIPPNHEILEESIRKSMQQMRLKKVDGYIQKIIQLYETTIVRHGLMLVGPAGSGKTRCYEILKHACSSLKGELQSNGMPFMTVHTSVLNPKSITLGQLYGKFDFDTHEWTDGILPHLIRSGVAAADSDKRWYILDGPVDALWIENMNTLLDDNKKLCLTSGEIIKLLPTQTMIFEVEDLKVASPATISRCGMIYLETHIVGIMPVIDCWIESIKEKMEDLASEISRLTYQLIYPAIELLRCNLSEIVPTVDITKVMAFVNLMNIRFSPKMLSKMGKSISPEANFKYQLDFIAQWIIFCFVWSFGANFDHRSREMFSDWVRKIQLKCTLGPPFPPEGLVYDYRVQDTVDVGDITLLQWVNWTEDINPAPITPDMNFADIEVPTIENIRNAYMIEHLLENNLNILCVGPSGSGKTMTISTKLTKNMSKKYICDFIMFSARTSANKTQDWIDSKLDKRRKNVYGPTLLKKQIFYIDDFNMPMVEVYGAQPPLELIRQFMNFNGWYDRREVGSFRNLEDVNFVCAMGPPSGGGNTISNRLLRHFHCLAFPEMTNEAKKTIFGAIIKSWLIRTPSSINILDSLLMATLKGFSTVCQELLPTPDRSHYTFNLRDLARIFQGILMGQPEKIETQNEMLSLWYHENLRVIGDRLTNRADIEWFNNLLHAILNEHFKDVSTNEILGDGTMFYGDFCDNNNRYERIIDREKMRKVLLNALEDYNNSSPSPMKLVLFEDAMNHICRISRILRQPRGNALLLGIGGSGRQSMTKIAAFLGDHICFQITSRKSYNLNDWHEDLKSVLLKAGVKNRTIVFLISDYQIQEEIWLEDLNNILNSGDIPNIFQPDELNIIFQAMRPAVMMKGLQINRTNMFNAYTNKVRDNLHNVITMSPVGDIFRARIRQFPALINCCVIDWFHLWPSSALRNVAIQFISEIQDEHIVDNVKNAIIDVCEFMHTSTIETSHVYFEVTSRHNYVTSASYLEMLSNYGKLLLKRKTKLASRISRFKTGLEKLFATEMEVKEMQIRLSKMKPELEQAANETASVISRIQLDTLQAQKAKELAQQQEREADLLKKQNMVIRNEAEFDLSQVQPMLLAAETSLKALNKSDITEVKAMKRPPAGVRLVIEAMCIVKKVEPLKLSGKGSGDKILDYWTPGSQMFADAGRFLAELENFDKTKITKEMIDKLNAYIKNPEFHPDKIIQVSKASHSLCLWLHAMYNYYFVNLKVQPKISDLQNAEEELKNTEIKLQSAIDDLQEIERGIHDLENVLSIKENAKKKLEADQKICEEKILRAMRLTEGLTKEQKRWQINVAEIQISYDHCVGDILISSGAIAYLTPFTDMYRTRLFTSWRNSLLNRVPHTLECTPESILGDPVLIHKWQMDGLPRDSMSVQSAILVANSNRWPLFIDPQSQADKWIRRTEKQSGMTIVKITDKDLLRKMENCVRFGRACLIENIGLEFDSALDSILKKNIFINMGEASIKIGDNIVPYNNQFRLYITTKLSNPHYTPEIAVKVLLVNFALTSVGLENQLLSLVVMQERSDLEEIRSALIISNAQMKKDLEEIEDKILECLNMSTGSTVDDVDLILTLEASKIKSNEIKSKVIAAEKTKVDIDSIRLLYCPVAKRGRVLFFCISDLQYINYMYQYSLEWFINIFIRSMNNADQNSDINSRIENINEYFINSLFTNVCRSLFERNKLHFAFLVCVRIRMENNLIKSNEWQHLISSTMLSHEETNPAADWLPTQCWKEIQALEILENFKNFPKYFAMNLREFQTFFDSYTPETYQYQEYINEQFDDMQKILILKALRPDRIVNAIQLYVTKYLGRQFVQPQITDLSVMFRESSSKIPLMFILSSGTDPASDLYKFADRLQMGNKLHAISLGQGQGPRAKFMIEQSIKLGNWVFFQNCHLAPSWMAKLETIVNTFPNTIHQDFRLWLTSMPTTNFPVSILENSTKMTIEPPRGIRANMLRSYINQVTETHYVFANEHEKHEDIKSLLMSICMFHSVLLERRKFGALGFNIPYEFTDGDLAICISQLYMFVMEYNELPFEVLVYTAGHINYGGRITDDWDRRCLLTILQDYYRLEAIASNYKFHQKGLYHQLPTRSTFDDYIRYIENLPLNDEPSIFGLHDNADIKCSTAEGYVCMETMLLLQSKVTGKATLNFEDSVLHLVDDMIHQIPQQFDIVLIQQRYPVMYEESLNTVLQQEALRYNELLRIIVSSLTNLSQALKGQIIMNELLEVMAQSLFNKKIPKIWHDRGYASLKPLGPWLIDLKKRIDFMRDWNDNGIPQDFWISGFFFPQALLTGTLQNFARRYALSIDTIDFSYQVQMIESKSRPKDGCIVHGLYLEGCRWNEDKLEESHPKKLYTEMKPIYLLPEKNHKCPITGIYICPVYKTLQRSGTLSTTGHSTNFVLSMEIPTKKSSMHWIKRGVALICALDY